MEYKLIFKGGKTEVDREMKKLRKIQKSDKNFTLLTNNSFVYTTWCRKGSIYWVEVPIFNTKYTLQRVHYLTEKRGWKFSDDDYVRKYLLESEICDEWLEFIAEDIDARFDTPKYMNEEITL